MKKEIIIKKLERDKAMAVAQIHSRELRIMELEDEMERCYFEITKQKTILEEIEQNLKASTEE